MVNKEQLNEMLKTYAELLLLQARQNLQRAGKAGGKLEKSLKYRITDYAVEFLAVPYAVFVDKGRRPSKKLPPLSAIVQWIDLSGLPIPLKAAYPIAKNIAKHGIKPSFFLTDALKKTQVPLRRELKRTIKQMLEDEIRQSLKH